MSTQSRRSRKKPAVTPPAPLRVPPPDHLWFQPPDWISAPEAARLTGYSLRTVDRWRADGIPAGACLTVLQSAVYGVIPHPDWNEWHVSADGRLCYWTGREPRPVTVGELHHRALLYAELSEARQELATLRAQVAASSPATPEAPDTAANDPQLRLPLLRAL